MSTITGLSQHKCAFNPTDEGYLTAATPTLLDPLIIQRNHDEDPYLLQELGFQTFSPLPPPQAEFMGHLDVANKENGMGFEYEPIQIGILPNSKNDVQQSSVFQNNLMSVEYYEKQTHPSVNFPYEAQQQWNAPIYSHEVNNYGVVQSSMHNSYDQQPPQWNQLGTSHRNNWYEHDTSGLYHYSHPNFDRHDSNLTRPTVRVPYTNYYQTMYYPGVSNIPFTPLYEISHQPKGYEQFEYRPHEYQHQNYLPNYESQPQDYLPNYESQPQENRQYQNPTNYKEGNDDTKIVIREISSKISKEDGPQSCTAPDCKTKPGISSGQKKVRAPVWIPPYETPQETLSANKKKIFQCSHCRKQFKDQFLLSGHCIISHPRVPLKNKIDRLILCLPRVRVYRCSKCQNIYPSQVLLTRHAKKVHNGGTTSSLKTAHRRRANL